MSDKTIDDLSNFIRQIDGRHTMGAGELAENIHAWFTALSPSPVPVEAEAAAYESRIQYSFGWGDWRPCSREAYEEFSVPGACAGRYPVEVRKLYTRPPKPAQGLEDFIDEKSDVLFNDLGEEVGEKVIYVDDLRTWMAGKALVPVEFIEVLDNAPYINPSNYDHDQVCDLNTAVREALAMLPQGASE